MKPRISVILPVYNQRPDYLRAAIDSILSQTFPDFELLLIDDGTTASACLAVLTEYSTHDTRIRLLRNPRNVGLIETLNRGLTEARAAFVARMDSDDISCPDRLEKQQAFLEAHSDCILVGTSAFVIDENGATIGALNPPVDSKTIRTRLLAGNPLLHPSWMFRKKVIMDLGGYNLHATSTEDYDLLLRLARQYRLDNLPDRLIRYRFNTKGISFRRNKRQEWFSLVARWRAIVTYGYPASDLIHAVLPLCAFLLLPSAVKIWLLRTKFRYNLPMCGKPTLGLFLELGGSFEEWNEVGFFSREITPYNRLARDFFGAIYIFTYGSSTDLRFSGHLEANIIIIPRQKHSRSYFLNFLYELWLPFKHFDLMRRCDIFKTNQNSGSLAAGLAKLLNPKAKLVVRSGYLGSELARRAHLPIVTKLYYSIAERFSYRLCDAALISGDSNASILRNRYSFLAQKIKTLNNFIDTNRFKPRVSEKRYVGIYVARFDPGKNHQALLDTMSITQQPLLFIGKGPTRSAIESRVASEALPVTILDAVLNERLPEYYNKARIAVFPSLHEGSPKSLLEAMACGLPVAALDSPGVSNIIVNEVNGLIGPRSSLQVNIRRLLSDPELRDRLGKAGRHTVLNEYSFEKLVTREQAIYRELLAL